MRFRPVYFLLSGTALVFSVFALSSWGLKQSIDFTGGSVVQYVLGAQTTSDRLKEVVASKQYSVKGERMISSNEVELRFPAEFDQTKAQEIASALGQDTKVLRFESVGPILSAEILKKTYVALIIASVGILLWVAWQFKSLQFGICAILATLHDTAILLGTFAALGRFQGIEVDILFVTAVLTVLSFSVHDTIVVYDRIRETRRKQGCDVPLRLIADKAVSETMNRSLNNSLTIIFMLTALFLMGGSTIKWFVFALLVGTISGTYSSPFVAVPLLVTWDELKRKWSLT
ncbi:MAG: protein translocase subunit SecF [Candidatus Blackburnbacteria bacterium]|nr:protein translocase subunit SecF [Candidatus Blackburnbacteria bacterium]